MKAQVIVGIFAAVLASSNTAHAGGPPGSYQLTPIGFTHGTVEGERVPSCGVSSEKTLGRYQDVTIRYARDVMVGATAWTLIGAYDSMTGARYPESDAVTRIELWFWQNDGAAKAVLTFTRLDEMGKARCITARNYAATYAP